MPPLPPPPFPSRSWCAYAAGELGARARAAADAIARDLVRGVSFDLPEGMEPGRAAILAASLASGAAGEAVFLFAHARDAARRDPRAAAESRAAGESRLGHAVGAVARLPMDASMFAGFPGVAWACAHVRGAAADDDLAPVDAALEGYVGRRAWGGTFDLATGLAGLGLYALERAPAAGAAPLLARVVDALAACAEPAEPGVTWRSDVAALPAAPGRRALGPWDLGMAHGVPGVIALLGAVALAGRGDATSERLLDDAVRWLLSRRLPPDAAGWFAASAGPGADAVPARLAWCYGDAGVAVALALAARARRDGRLVGTARELAGRVASRAADTSGVRDAGLCHGAAGVAHACARLAVMLEHPALWDAARAWLVRALEAREPGAGVGGFRALHTDVRGAERWASDPGALTGAAGIGLACLAAVADDEPGWDRMLALSARETPRAPSRPTVVR